MSIPQTPAIERAIKAFRKAHPSCPHHVRAWKNRASQIIRVRGYEDADKTHGIVAVWSYSDNGYLQRVK